MPPATPLWNAALLQRARDIRLLVLDVDGVLTDGGLWFDAHGESLKRFHTLDGYGLELLGRAGVACAVISGRESAALRLRLAQLGLEQVFLGVKDKLPCARALLERLHLDWTQTAAMGDDWPDLPLLRRARLACAPPNAHLEVRAVAHHVTQRAGGNGAVRELCDLLLAGQGRYAQLLDALDAIP